MLRALWLIINLFKPCMSLICGYIMASYMAYNIERSIKASPVFQSQRRADHAQGSYFKRRSSVSAMLLMEWMDILV